MEISLLISDDCTCKIYADDKGSEHVIVGESDDEYFGYRLEDQRKSHGNKKFFSDTGKVISLDKVKDIAIRYLFSLPYLPKFVDQDDYGIIVGYQETDSYKEEKNLLIRRIYLTTDNFYKGLVCGPANYTIGPETEDELSKKYGITYYCSSTGEDDSLAIKRGDKVLEILNDFHGYMPLVEDVLYLYLMDYLDVKSKMDRGDKDIDEGDRIYKILFEDFFSKEEIEELIEELIGGGR